MTPRCLKAACLLYETVVETLIPVSSTGAAEMVKLLDPLRGVRHADVLPDGEAVRDEPGNEDLLRCSGIRRAFAQLRSGTRNQPERRQGRCQFLTDHPVTRRSQVPVLRKEQLDTPRCFISKALTQGEDRDPSRAEKLQ